jgi:hypothetical protein
VSYRLCKGRGLSPTGCPSLVGEPPATISANLEFGPSGSAAQLIGLVAFDGKATVLGATSTDFALCARTQT